MTRPLQSLRLPSSSDRRDDSKSPPHALPPSVRRARLRGSFPLSAGIKRPAKSGLLVAAAALKGVSSSDSPLSYSSADKSSGSDPPMRSRLRRDGRQVRQRLGGLRCLRVSLFVPSFPFSPVRPPSLVADSSSGAGFLPLAAGCELVGAGLCRCSSELVGALVRGRQARRSPLVLASARQRQGLPIGGRETPTAGARVINRRIAKISRVKCS